MQLRSHFHIKPVCVEGEADACRVEFTVDQQTFCIGPDYMENREQAEWYVDMFCTALDRAIQRSR